MAGNPIGKTLPRGASPSGIETGAEAEAARDIRAMFGRVAPRYDLLNRLLSGQVDRYWRHRLVKAVRPHLGRPGVRVGDFCCGTGDVLLTLAREHRRLCPSDPTSLLGSDFCRPMLEGAAEKMRRARTCAKFIEADASRFPMRDASLDLITVAYGFRNLANYRRGIEEFARLLDEGGCLAILEFSQPQNRLWGPLFNAYFRHVLPRIGNALSGAGDAYSYLQDSVERFLAPEELANLMRECGFRGVEYRLLTGGVSALHLGIRR